MPAVQRQGDADSVGGVATSGVASVRVNGRPIVVNGISVTPHFPCGKKKAPKTHCNATTSNGNSTVRAGGKPVVTANNTDTCGHPRVGGSPNVRAG
jgi:uncharacterized Zn-binding protein involved in type VI secretion